MAYTKITNDKLATMLEDEANKVAKDATICTATELKYPPGIQPTFSLEQMRKWFVRDFKAEDFPEILKLHDQAVRRVGPAAKDAIGELNLKLISLEGIEKSESVCQSVVEVLPYLKKLSADLRHTQ